MKVSVLIPAYNAEKYIYECINSICDQSYKDLQIVIIDDGSKDSTLRIINEFATRDQRIEVYTREKRGVATTRNELIDLAQGKYSLFVDADDWIEPEMIETLLSLIIGSGAEIAMCGNFTETSCISQKHPPRPIEQHTIWHKKEFLEKFLLHKQLTGALWNKLILTDLYKSSKFTPGIGYGEDAMVIWDILNMTTTIIATNRQLYHYRMNEDSISHQGFSNSKMSVIPVWEHICSSIDASQQHLLILAKARYGAEVSLLLFEAAKHHAPANDPNVMELRQKLSLLYPFMKQSGTLSSRFMLFAFMAKLNWPITSFLTR